MLSSPVALNAPVLRISNTDITTLFQPRVWIQAVIPSASTNGPVTITAQTGTATLTSVNRRAAGTYAIAWSPNINNFNYIVQGNVRNVAGYVSFNGTALTGCNILTYNATGALTDAMFHIMMFRMP